MCLPSRKPPPDVEAPVPRTGHEPNPPMLAAQYGFLEKLAPSSR